MTIVTNTTDRKALTKALAEHLGTTSKYMGMPSCGYQVGNYIIDKEGNITGEDFEAIRDFLQTNGCLPEEDNTKEPEEQQEPEEDGPWDAEDELTISLPDDDLTPLQMKNLILMLYSKQYLINRMADGDTLSIPDSVAARLMESAPENLEDFIPLLEEVSGFSFADGKVTLSFPLHEDAQMNMVYAMLSARILKAAKEATRVFAERQEPENEKFYARAWLLRLGYGGADCKAERHILLKHLKGHSAFPNDDAANRHKEKYAAIRKAKKEEVASND